MGSLLHRVAVFAGLEIAIESIHQPPVFPQQQQQKNQLTGIKWLDFQHLHQSVLSSEMFCCSRKEKKKCLDERCMKELMEPQVCRSL